MEKDVILNLHLSEDETDTMAFATLTLRGDHFEAIGKARRNPIDPPMPVVGEELAISRALNELAAKVTEAAGQKIETFLVKE